ncbi:hypothetical protein O181_013012 [Austropuccinia psidii MF-1]|uniref:Uncharacterized protein n=1 Tax=Austropuccinia psidii MF-1 TaxID=1389203 RepID=A0A9Q3BYT3_9BASI|nr:hypothetical protein [Austropuccinia psidii MF-1]
MSSSSSNHDSRKSVELVVPFRFPKEEYEEFDVSPVMSLVFAGFSMVMKYPCLKPPSRANVFHSSYDNDIHATVS